MLNFMFINFFLRKSKVDPTTGAVYVRVTISKDRETIGAVSSVSGLDLPKSIMIHEQDWDDKGKRVKDTSPHAKYINDAIVECERKLTKIQQQYEAFDMKLTVKKLKAAALTGGRMRPSIPDLVKAFLEEKEATNTNQSTVNTYAWKFRPLLAFLKHEGKIDQDAEDFTPGTLKRFRTYLIARRANSERSADKTCQVVKTLLLWAAGNETISENPLLNTRIHVDKTPNLECLDQDELAILKDAQLIPPLRKVADCFRFACYTGLAYQDMKALTQANIKEVEGQWCIVGNRMKTGTEYCIPMTAPLFELIEKYGTIQMPLPKLGDYNPMLRQIMLVLGIDKRITSHTARKTFCDWLVNELNLTDEAAVVAMGQKHPRELAPYRKTRPKRLLSEFPDELLRPVEKREMPTPTPTSTRIAGTPFSRVA